MKELWSRGADGRLHWQLHPGQWKALNCLARIILVLAGTQGGKTSFGPLWLLNEIKKRGPGDYIAASATYDLFKLKMLPEMERLFVETLGWHYKKNDRIIESPDKQTRIILRSAESPGGLESASVKGAWLDEWGQNNVTIECWEAIRRRVALYKGRVLITTTPYNLGWLKLQIYDRWKAGDKKYAVISFRSIDNPAFPLEEYETAKAEMPDWRFRMFYNGEFTKPAGLIYNDYEDSYAVFEPMYAPGVDLKQLPGPGRYIIGGNLVRPFSIPKHWQRYIGVDFGAVNTALIWLAEDPYTHYLYLCREKLGGGLTGPEHAREALAYREPVKLWLGGAPSEDDARNDWQMAGAAVCRPFVDDVETGIDRGVGLIKSRRLFVFDSCVMTRGQFGTYSRELDAAGEPTEKISDKAKFHLLDAYRYIATAFPIDKPAESKPPEPEMGGRAIGSLAEYLLKQSQETEDYY